MVVHLDREVNAAFKTFYLIIAVIRKKGCNFKVQENLSVVYITQMKELIVVF